MVSLLRLSLLQFFLLSILKVSFLKHKAERITILFKMFSDSPLPTKFHNLEFKTLHYLCPIYYAYYTLTLPPVESAIPLQLSFIQLQFLLKFTLSQKAPSSSAPDGEIQESRDCLNSGQCLRALLGPKHHNKGYTFIVFFNFDHNTMRYPILYMGKLQQRV